MHRNKAKSFSEIRVGDTAEFDFQINDEEHASFAELVQDYSPVHWNPKYIAETQYDKQIGYGFFLLSFLSRFYGEFLPGGSSICISQDAKFVKPYYLGEQLQITGKVVRKSEATKFVEIQTKVFRDNEENKECIFKGNGTVQILPARVDCTNSDNILFEGNEAKVTQEDITQAIAKVGIKEGDTVMVHSDISVFGKLRANSKDELLGGIVESMKKNVGKNGTVAFPTFTYSFCHGKEFDLQKSKSTVGVLSEYFRKMPEVTRTNHPIFSFAVWGTNKKDMLKIGKDSFGEASFFANLRKNKGKILLFGVSLQTCTFIHYIEQSFAAPYRYLKKFKGKTIINGTEYDDYATFYVRNLEEGVSFSAAQLEKSLLEKGLMKRIPLGNSYITCVDAEILFNETITHLENDINFLRGDL